jgi:hypothetical protein
MIFYFWEGTDYSFGRSLRTYTWLSSLEHVAKHFDAEFKVFDIAGGTAESAAPVINLPEPHSKECIFFASHDLNWNHNVFTKHVKDNFPNSKIVIYGTDLDAWNINICKNRFLTNTPVDLYNSDWFNDYSKSLDFGKVYNKYKKNDTLFFKGLEAIKDSSIDLFLDCLGYVCDDASRLWNSRRYIYNVSTSVAEQFLSKKEEAEIEFDGICLANFHVRGDSDRGQMHNYLNENGYRLRIGGDQDKEKHEIDFIRSLYAKSKVCLGTSTRGGRLHPRSVKGFRDWIAPLCGIPLIYDDYSQVVDLPVEIPFYKWQKWEEIIELTDVLYRDTKLRKRIVEEQTEFSLANTLDKQLINIFNDVLFSTEQKVGTN